MGRASDPSERKREERAAASERAATRMLTQLAVRVEQLSRFIDDPPDGETFLTSIQFKVGGGWDDGVLAIVKAHVGGIAVVGFHGDDTLMECLRGLGNRIVNGSMKWKEDRPYGERTGD